MKKKHYSFLDQRRPEFEVDYEEFCKNTSVLHVSKTAQEKKEMHVLVSSVWYSKMKWISDIM